MAEGLPLNVRDLCVTGDEGRPILRLDALSLTPGQSLGISGPSGAGKTTLLLALSGLLLNVTGRIEWGGADIVGMRFAERRAFRAAHLGMIFQDSLLFDELAPLANAGLFALFSPGGSREPIMHRAEELLARMGVPTDRASTTTLSGGERQRVTIARALASDPGVLLADEPTAALHREAADLVIEDLASHGQGKTVITASHDSRLLARMERVIELEGGVQAAA
jgi:ABC-type lipoprotein export system ATPase subunit